jgi:hypothetical protein
MRIVAFEPLIVLLGGVFPAVAVPEGHDLLCDSECVPGLVHVRWRVVTEHLKKRYPSIKVRGFLQRENLCR